jgi:hypothetical protein
VRLLRELTEIHATFDDPDLVPYAAALSEGRPWQRIRVLWRVPSAQAGSGGRLAPPARCSVRGILLQARTGLTGRGRASSGFPDFYGYVVLSMDAVNVVAHSGLHGALVAARPPEAAAPGCPLFAAGRAVLGIAQAAAPAPLVPVHVVPGDHGALVVLFQMHAVQAMPIWRALSRSGRGQLSYASAQRSIKGCPRRVYVKGAV